MLNNLQLLLLLLLFWHKVFEDAKLCRYGVRCGKELEDSSLESLLLMWMLTVHSLSCHCFGITREVIEVFRVL